MTPHIRAATTADFAALQDIERAAGRLFAAIGMDDIASDEPPSIEELQEYADRGHAWVLDDDGAPIGYALVDVVDGCAHIEQISLHPDHHRRGHGRFLLRDIEAWARRNDMPALTLTSFRDVPWNAPYYERCGFRTLSDDELGPELRALRAREAEDGLDPAQRVCMRLNLA